MAALVSTVSTASPGTAYAGAAVSASDTITAAQLGSLGADLVIINAGASPDVVAIVDGGLTPAGNAGVSGGGTVTNATSKIFYISPRAVNLTTGLVTITHSFITTVTYVLLPRG